MRRSLLAILLLVAAPLAFADGFKKAYFGATKPGSWAKYTLKTSAGDMTSLYTRLADDDQGQARIEMRTEFSNKETPTSINRYTLRKGFALDRDLMDYGPGIVAGEMGIAGEVQPTDPATLAIIAKTLARYGANAKFLGSDTVAGKKCDRYSYTVRFPGDPEQIENGEIWLNDAVPFGLVKQKATTKDPGGKEISSYEETLVESGVGEAK